MQTVHEYLGWCVGLDHVVLAKSYIGTFCSFLVLHPTPP